MVSEKIDTGKSLGTGIGKIWYGKKVSEPVSEKFGTGADFVAKILEFRRFLIGTGTGTGNFLFFQVVSEKFGTEKVSEPVSVKFGTGADFCCQNFES